MSIVTRRQVLRSGSVWLATLAAGVDVACDHAPSASTAARDPSAPYGYPAPQPAIPDPTGCFATETNIEGPYYRAGAPVRDDLTDTGMPGTRLIVSGRILGPDCQTAVEGAALDVWQADSDGHYDNDHHSLAAMGTGPFRLRAKLTAGAGGSFRFRTIIPGRYLNGPQYRPAHIHVKVTAAGHVPLTTQLYFEGDPHNAVDPFIRRSLVMRISSEAAEKQARFDIALAKG
jgi:catechol 1,2-dioxygenase